MNGHIPPPESGAGSAGNSLATLLRSSTVIAAGPRVEHLRVVATARRRRHRAVTVLAAAVVLGLVGLAGVRANPSTNRVETADLATTETIVDPTTTTSATTSSTGSTVVGTAQAVAPPEVEAVPEPASGGPPILIPRGDWELQSLSSTSIAGSGSRPVVLTEAGGLGPVAWIGYNAGIGTLFYADGPQVAENLTSPAGRTVRVGYSVDPDHLIAIFLVEGGSVAVTSFDIERDPLLSLVDAIDVVDGAVVIEAGALPPGFRVETPASTQPSLVTHYQVGSGRSVALVRIQRRRHTSDDLTWIRGRPSITETVVQGRRVLLSVGDNGPAGWTMAVVFSDEWMYTVEIPPWDPSDPPATLEQMEDLVASLVEVGDEDLLGQIPDLRDRRALLGRWLADLDAGVAARSNIDWLFEGPPLHLSESQFYYQFMTCLIAADWVVSGDPARLDELDANLEWAVVADLRRHHEEMARAAGEGPPELHLLTRDAFGRSDLAAARSAVTAEDRRETALFGQCIWARPEIAENG